MEIVSGIKSQILALLFSAENEEFYIRQIASKLGRSPMGVLFGLESLEEEGILTSRYLGRMRFFKVNKGNPTYREIRILIIKKYGIPIVIKEEILKIKNISEAFIYGSVAKGGFDSKSDIDLFILGDPDYEKLNRNLRTAEVKLGREINFHLMTSGEYKTKKINNDPYILDIEEGKKIYLIHEGKSV